MARRTRRGKSYKVFWSKSRIRRVVGSGVVLWIIVALTIPQTTYGTLLGTEKLTTSGTYALHVPGVPPVEYSATISYSVVGAFSVGAGNPIHMSALVYDVNRSDFSSLFSGIGLLYQDVPIANVAGSPVALLPTFHPAGDARWTSDATIVFAHPINFTGPLLAVANPPENASASTINSAVTSQVKAYNYPFPTLKPQSFTNQLSSKESALKYGATGSAVVLILLLPLFYRLLLPREGKEENGSLP